MGDNGLCAWKQGVLFNRQVTQHCLISVERRRRDKINNWIVQLSKLVPDCAQEPVKQTQAVSEPQGHFTSCSSISQLKTLGFVHLV